MSKELVTKINNLGNDFTNLIASIFLDEHTSQSQKDRFRLELAKHCAMKPNGLAAQYLEHFLDGSGTPKTFSTQQLVNQDNGVSQRLNGEVYRRSLEIKTLREKCEDSRMSLTKAAQKDRDVITIFQKNFRIRDWQLALGTFAFNWEVIQESEKQLRVRVWGENTYTWHPNSKRITQFLHQAGSRLSKAGYAKDFQIVAQPMILIVSKQNTDMLRMSTFTQTNPAHRKFPVR